MGRPICGKQRIIIRSLPQMGTRYPVLSMPPNTTPFHCIVQTTPPIARPTSNYNSN